MIKRLKKLITEMKYIPLKCFDKDGYILKEEESEMARMDLEDSQNEQLID